MAIRPFIDTLTALRYGELHDELSEKLNELVAACADTGKAGTLTLTLKLKPSKGAALEISDELLEEGYTAGFLAQRLGYRHRGLQFRAARVTVRNAARVARLHRELTT